jgi:tRNA nucleotidyltransferase (CCA-adding enzyme)
MHVNPRAVRILDALTDNGFEAWLVGGCVRDSIMGRAPKDWDVATDAAPEQVKRVFRNCRVLETGVKHGTVTVLLDRLPVEVTTYRVDGEYLDGRHPSSVQFVSDIDTDLARRDFTINAIAYNPARGLRDPFGGAADIKHHLVRCVGNPDERLNEDGLRIMRALRFASVFSFSLADDLSRSLHRNRDLLRNIAAERISAEVSKLLPGDGVVDILPNYHDVLAVFIPEISAAAGFDQKNRHHCFDVWTHIAHSVAAAPPDVTVRLALLFHDLGKPETFTVDENGVGHFYGHAKVSEDIAARRLKALRFGNETVSAVCTLIRYHDAPIDAERLPRWISRLGELLSRKLLDVKIADNKAQSPGLVNERLLKTELLRAELDRLLSEKRCFSLADLAIDGGDIKDLGVTEGPAIGSALEHLLDAVVDGDLPNERDALLACARNMPA